MRQSRIVWALLLFSLLFALSCRPQTAETDLTIAAASDLTKAFEEIGREFQKTTGTKVVFNFGSSGMLAKQIEQGAPIDLFAAANVAFVNQLEQKGLILTDTKKSYARGLHVLCISKNNN